MPPPIIESDAESATAGQSPEPKIQEIKDTQMNDVDPKDEGPEDDGEEEDEDEPETYVVEKIMDHRSDFADNMMRYLVKWKGYEKKSDRTWEPESNLEGARDILEAYWKTLGGKPEAGSEQKPKKRGRQSTGAASASKDTKKPRVSKNERKSGGAVQQDVELTPNVGFIDAGDDDWKPPPVKDGSWDPLVQSVDTVVRENSDGELWGFLIWSEKSESGRFYRSKAKLPVIYKACPQRMLHFYEKHLVFTTAGENETPGDEASGAT